MDAGRISQRIMARLGLDDDRHAIMRRNVACHVAAAGERADVFARSDDAPPKVAHDAVADAERHKVYPRPLYKLERDLGHPYSDRQVAERVQALDRALVGTLERLRAASQFPTRMWVAGSLVKPEGFGAHSDADIVVEGPTHQALLAVVPETLQHHTDIQLHALREGDLEQSRDFFGKLVAIDPREALEGDNPLQRIHQESNGFIIR